MLRRKTARSLLCKALTLVRDRTNRSDGVRGNITHFVMEVAKFTDTTTLEDSEYYQDRLRETLGLLTSLDD